MFTMQADTAPKPDSRLSFAISKLIVVEAVRLASAIRAPLSDRNIVQSVIRRR